MTQVTIEYRFASLNEYINAERSNKYFASVIKKRETEVARLNSNGIAPVTTYPVDITFQWFCKKSRTDPDNISFAQKFILDGFVASGLLKDDSWKFVSSLKHEFNESELDYVIVNIDRKREK